MAQQRRRMNEAVAAEHLGDPKRAVAEAFDGARKVYRLGPTQFVEEGEDAGRTQIHGGPLLIRFRVVGGFEVQRVAMLNRLASEIMRYSLYRR